jgi:ubiquinone/menaquinone biosynthesis C-methylase UbiE
MDQFAWVRAFLACPDCRVSLEDPLRCPSCGRNFAPDADGIINALPAEVMTGAKTREELSAAIEAGQIDKIPLFEMAFHDEQAPYYDTLYVDPLPVPQYFERLVARQIYSYVRTFPFVLDLCCGTGKSSIRLLRLGLPVVGMDISRNMLRLYRRHCPDKNLLLIQADVNNPPLLPDSCPAISIIGGLHHIPDQGRCIRACCVALLPDGIFIVHEPIQTGELCKAAVVQRELYALADPHRVWRAIKRRLGFAVPVEQQEEILDYSPYEAPFKSPENLRTLIPDWMHALSFRSQGYIGLKEFPKSWQGSMAAPLASFVVALDSRMSDKSPDDWSGGAIFGAFQKRRGRPAS